MSRLLQTVLTLSQGKATRNGDPPSSAALYLQRSANHPGTIIHDLHPHAGTGGRGLWQACTVIFYCQGSMFTASQEADCNVFRLPMFDRIVDRFLSNTIQVSGHIGVMNQHRFVGLETAGNIEQVFHFAGPALES